MGPVQSVNLTAQTLQVQNTTIWIRRSDLLVLNGVLSDLLPGRAVRVLSIFAATGRLEAVTVRLE